MRKPAPCLHARCIRCSTRTAAAGQLVALAGAGQLVALAAAGQGQ